MSLPLTWADKINSPSLADFIEKHGAEYCMTAEEINEMRDAVNEICVVQNYIKSNESLSLAKRKNDVLHGILDQYTGEEMTLSKVTGTPVVDDIIYFKLEDEYFKRNYTDINPLWFGAKGNGVDSDYVPLLAAINALNAKLTLKIKFNYNLGGASIVLPANVTLNFEGGSITNGSMVLNNTTIDYKNIESVLTDVVLTGTITNGTLDVRLFGILPNKPLIDSTVIYNTNLVGLDVILFFTRGAYYFSELHVTKHFFQIRGEESNDLEVRTVFHPFNMSQYYIIKIGGTKFTLNNTAAAWAKNSSIMHVWFTTPLGFTGLNLPSPDAVVTNIPYMCSALILDKAQGGRYAINGHTLHNMPLLSLGNAYELYFDYIKMQGNHGKSDLPVIQVTNNFQQGGYISASVIHQLWVDVMVGPVFVTSDLAGINEFMINNIYIEGTIEWDNESVFTENRFTRLTKTLPDYYATVNNVVPMFSIGGIVILTIGNMIINATDTEWQNSLDTIPLGWNTRGFFKLNTISSDIKIGSISDGGWSQNMLLKGNASVVGRNTFHIVSCSPEIAFYNQVENNFDFISNTNNVNVIKLKSNHEYFNNDLSFFLEAKFLTNIGLDNHFVTPDEPKYNKAIATRWDNCIINQSGFYVNDDKIKIVGKLATTSNAINIEYYNVSNNLISTQNYTALVTANVIFENTITLIKPVGYSYLKLISKNTGFLLKTYSIKTETVNVEVLEILDTKQDKIDFQTIKGFVIPRDLINPGPSRKFVKICDNVNVTFISGSISISGDFFGAIVTGDIVLNVGVYVPALSVVVVGKSRVSSETSQAAVSLGISDIMVVGGFIGFYVYSESTNPVNVIFNGSILTESAILFDTSSNWEAFTFPTRRGIEIDNNLNAVGNIKGNLLANNQIYLVANLPTPPQAGFYATVSDATSPTYLGALTGGGSVVCPVYYNGSAWVSH